LVSVEPIRGGAVKTVKVRKDKKTGECFLKLDDFASIIDISRVKKYTLEPVDDYDDKNPNGTKALILKFYDENDQIVEAKS